MRLREVESARSPDLFFISAERAALVKHTYLDGPADIAMEIVSPGTVAIDRHEKMSEYARAGIREYWLVDPMERTVEFYERGADGRYRLVPCDGSGVLSSRVLDGFFLRPKWLWDTPNTKTMEVLRELGVF